MEYANDAAAQAAYITNATESVEVNFETGTDYEFYIGDYKGLDYWAAPKIIVSQDIVCTAVSIHLGTRVGTVVGNMTFRLETDNAGEPSGTLVHANATGTLIPSDEAWNKYSFTSFILSSGTYWLVVYVADQDTDNSLKWDVTIGGTNTAASDTDHGASWGISNHQPYFRLYSKPFQCYSEATIKEQGSYSLKALAEQTDSLNLILTRTVSPTIDLSDKTEINFDIRASRTGSNIKIDVHDSGGVTTEITPNITSADTFQTVTWDISGVSNANKDAIDSIIITVVNADADNTFYIDNMYAESQVTYYAQKSTSANDDSAWQAETEIGSDSSGFGHMSLVPMDSGKVMALFNDYDGTYNLKYRIYDSSWGASTTAVTDCKDNTAEADWDEYHWFSAVADSSNNVHVVYVDSDDNDLNYIYYNGSSWSSAQEIYTGTVTHPSLSYDSTSGNLVAFFIEGNAVKYKVKKSGSWGDPSGGTTLKSGLDSPTYLGSAYSDATSIGIIWRETSSSPYAISYAILTLTEARSDIIRFKGGVRLKGGMRLK